MTPEGLRKQQAKKSPTCKSGFFSLAETEPFELYSSPVFRAFCFLGSPTYLCCVNVTNGPYAPLLLGGVNSARLTKGEDIRLKPHARQRLRLDEESRRGKDMCSKKGSALPLP